MTAYYPAPIPTSSTTKLQLRLTTWNCRGLNSGELYIHHLADIIVITEHWLWPFESQRLSQVHPEVTTDTRLNENSSLTRVVGVLGYCGGRLSMLVQSLVFPATGYVVFI